VELEQVFDHFPKCHIKIPLRDFKEKLGREDIFKPTIANEHLHQDSNDNGVTVVNFLHHKKSSCLQYNVPTPEHS
jgi:hypothetical protein